MTYQEAQRLAARKARKTRRAQSIVALGSGRAGYEVVPASWTGPSGIARSVVRTVSA